MSEIHLDNPLRRQVFSLPALLRQQYEDLEPKTRSVLTTPEIYNIQRIVLTGCGDSYAAALAMRDVFEKLCKIRTEVVPTLDLARSYDSRNLGYAPGSPLVIAVSNSGAVARIGEAAQRCREKGATVLAVTGKPESVLGQNATKILQLAIPSFESAPGTRSYLVSLLALYLLAVRIGEVRARYTMDTARSHRKAIAGQADALEALLPAMDHTALELAEAWKSFPAFDFIGAGGDYATAWFGHAKIFEATGGFAMHINSEEWLHLNFFMRENTRIGTVIVADTRNPAHSRTRETAGYAAQLDRPLAIITNGGKDDFGAEATYFQVPTTQHPESFALTAFPPLCLLAGYLQALLGERNGRGCEGPWSFSKGAACVRQSEINIL